MNRFIFTMIDPTKPRRKFSFVLSANDEELYELLECEPPLNSNKAMSHLDHLNESSDISQFVRCMSKFSKVPSFSFKLIFFKLFLISF